MENLHSFLRFRHRTEETPPLKYMSVCMCVLPCPERARYTMTRRWDALSEDVRAIAINVFMIFIYLNIFIRE